MIVVKKINKRIALIILSFLCILTNGCIPLFNSTTQAMDTPIPIEMVIALTASSAQTQTATMSVVQSPSVEFTSTPSFTETPTLSFPVSYVYEGMTASCVVANAYCVTNIVFVARLTIDAQGNVTGIIDKYLADIPPMEFKGTTTNLYGLLELGSNTVTGVKEEKIEFTGSLNDNLSVL